jgi:hypothetical protein
MTWHTGTPFVVVHLSEGEGIIFQQQKCYYIGESKEGAKGKLGTYYIQ